jgi:hypothetical protein
MCTAHPVDGGAHDSEEPFARRSAYLTKRAEYEQERMQLNTWLMNFDSRSQLETTNNAGHNALERMLWARDYRE